MADFSAFGQIYQFQGMEATKYHCTLNRHHFNAFQLFSKIHHIHLRVSGVISGAHFAKNHPFYPYISHSDKTQVDLYKLIIYFRHNIRDSRTSYIVSALI